MTPMARFGLSVVARNRTGLLRDLAGCVAARGADISATHVTTGVDAEVYLVELKAAAVDVVAEAALARGAEVVLAANDVVSPELDERLASLVPDRSRA